MDTFLVEYLRSGKAWLLVGSGPSIDLGYPTNQKLAEAALALVRLKASPPDYASIEAVFKQGDFPLVFECVITALGAPQVLDHLRKLLRPSRPGRIYQLLTQWPIPVYLTTNFDDEIHDHLVALNVAYISYSNSADHMSLLNPELSGAIFKIHGDLRSETGLILTTSQYRAVQEDVEWEHWRTKLTSIFQLKPVIVVGHSLSDPNIRHVLEAAKQGAGVHQPVCWIAPDVPPSQVREYLEECRIRVISYDNRDGTHSNLYRMIENVGQFVYPRTAIRIRKEIEEVASSSPLGQDAAAPGFFVFNKLLKLKNFDQVRIVTVCAAIQSVIPELRKLKHFTIEQAVHLAGWPPATGLTLQFEEEVTKFACESELLTRTDDGLTLGPKADTLSSEATAEYSHLKERFRQSLILRIRRNYPQLNNQLAQEMAAYIESSLVGFFREDGLSLATTLLANANNHSVKPVPSSIIAYVNQAAAHYDGLLQRQAFSTVAIDIFSQPEDADKEYLGRVSQGFFSFHALGFFGEAATERLAIAKQTVWLIDSSAQIPALAFAAPTSAVFRDAFARLTGMGIRLFTTEKVFNETAEHYWFANMVIETNGVTSPMIMAAALGQSPYRKANQFLEGFVRWQAAGNPADWETYNSSAFGHIKPSQDCIRQALSDLGIEVIPFENWPGYKEEDQVDSADITARIANKWKNGSKSKSSEESRKDAAFNKAEPEAEVLLIVQNERQGRYHIISVPGQLSPAWFVSQTSMLNLVYTGQRITWQPEAFLRFASTLAPSTDSETASRAFDILLFAFTESGVSLLDQSTLLSVFGGVIDQATISLESLSEAYNETLLEKYTEDPRSVLERVPAQHRPLAALQISKEIVIVQNDRRKLAEARAADASRRATKAEKEAELLKSVKQKIDEKRRKREQRARRKNAQKRRKKHK